MSKKLLFIASLFATSLFSASIDFQMANQNPQRVTPSNSTQILSFHDSVKEPMKSVVNIAAKRRVSAENRQR